MRRRERPTAARRPGFTLVELLVAAALCVVIMAILATAFSTGMDTLSQLKSVVGLSEQLRATDDALSRDLSSPHLEDEAGAIVRVSDPKVQAAAWTQASGKRGFFSVYQGSSGAYEGIEDGVASVRATDHWFALSVQLPGGSAQEAFAAPLSSAPQFDPLRKLSLRDLDPSGQQFMSRWAEVTYFLRQTAMMTVAVDADPNNPTATPPQPIPVFTLYRRQRALAPSPVSIAFSNPGNTQTFNELREQLPDVSFATVTPGQPNQVQNGQAPVNTPESITVPSNRFSFIADWRNSNGNSQGLALVPAGLQEVFPQPTPPQTAPRLQTPLTVAPSDPYGSDVMMNSVISMQIQLLYDANTQFLDLPATAAPSGQQWPRTYDTANDPTKVTKNRIRAIQLKIRAYDGKNRMTRQMTITRDL